MSKRAFHSPTYAALVFGLLLATWVVLSGLFDFFHLGLGVISCALVTWLSADLLFEERGFALRSRFVQAVRLATYLVWLLGQIVLANLHLLRLAFSGRERLQPQIVRYRCALGTDFEKFLLANSITLTPGTVTIKIVGGTFYVHAISDVAAAGLNGEMERRIARIFGGTEPARGAGDTGNAANQVGAEPSPE